MASDYTIQGITAWLGLNHPTAAQTVLITLAADDAENAIRKIRQQKPTDEIENIYKGLAVEMGVFLYQKRGVDSTNSFTENGISRVYESGSFPISMMRRITPKASTAFDPPAQQSSESDGE